jgi:acetylserotonin N-methyltransferase
LGRFLWLADLGGATGHLAHAASRRYPALSAVVFDLPGVMPMARDLVTASVLADQVELVAGDFVQESLPEADLFALGRILLDWRKDKVQRLLRAVFERRLAKPGSGTRLLHPPWGQPTCQ